ncbi:hypothetical protein G6F31_019978 [Rhizopus arrhizus]|nr:hypothetical protein G6F31_019978 [Rhizopus arrhizus]
MLVLSPHMGVLLLSLASVWSFAPLPDGYTLAHYSAVFSESQGMIANTLLYCGLAAGGDVILGTAIAYLMLRTRLPARQWLDFMASAALAIPGIGPAIGFLRTFRGIELPGGCPTRCGHAWRPCSRSTSHWKRPRNRWAPPA